MKPIKEIRLENLLKLASKYRFDKDFCQAIDILPTYMTALKNRDKGIGDKLARQIETSLKLAPGWMDKDHAETCMEIISGGATLAALIDELPTPVSDAMKHLVFAMALEFGKAGRSPYKNNKKSPK